MISFPFLPLKHTRIIYYIYICIQDTKEQVKNKFQAVVYISVLWSSSYLSFVSSRTCKTKQGIPQQKYFTHHWAFRTHHFVSVHSAAKIFFSVESFCDTQKVESSCNTQRVESSCDTKGQVFLWHMKGWVFLWHTKGRVLLRHMMGRVFLWHTKGWVWHMKGWVLFWHMKGRVLFQHTKCQVLFRHIKHRVLLWHTKGQVLLCSSEESNFVAHQDTHQNTQQFKEVWGVCVGGWGVGAAGGGVVVGGGQVRMCRVRLWIQWVLSYQLKLLIDDRFTRAGMHASSQVFFIRSYKLTVGSVQSGIEFSECSVKN